jgi:hypothetical protein
MSASAEGSAVAPPGLSCSSVMRAAGVDPIGTAGSYDGYLLVEWPLPWPRDLSMLPELEPLTRAATAAGLRFQGLVPTDGDAPRHVIAYRRTVDQPTGLLVRQEVIAEPGAVVPFALELLASDSPSPAEADEHRVIDVLICTHGRRDRCCGSLGTSLFQKIDAIPGRLGSTVRVWRTSHTGGHRFAPTAIVLPDATAWAYLDDESLTAIVQRSRPARDLLDHYRGCVLLDSPELQALEREVLRERDWPLIDLPRSGSMRRAGVCTLTVEIGDGLEEQWVGTVETTRTLPVPECGRPIEESKKLDRELACTSLGRVDRTEAETR